MHETDRFALISGAEAGSPKSELWTAARRVAEVAGSCLEARFEVTHDGGSAFLLVTSYNSPYEELLHIILVDADGNSLETKELGSPYAPGVIEHVRVSSPNTVDFDLQGTVTVRVLDRPRGIFRERLELIDRATHGERA